MNRTRSFAPAISTGAPSSSRTSSGPRTANRTSGNVAGRAPPAQGLPHGVRGPARLACPDVTQPSDPLALADSAARELTAALGDGHDVAVVMGSGWAPAADAFGEANGSVAIGDLPGFAAPTAIGHGGQIRSVRVGDRVKIRDGAFTGMEGEVKELLEAKGHVRVEVTIFGRPVSVELEYWQVEPV